MPLVARPAQPARQEVPATPCLIAGSLHHTRHRPVRHTFTTRHYSWLIDLDAPPDVRGVRFDARDHLGSPTTLTGLKDNAIRLVESAAIPGDPVDRVVMLAHPRILGHTFNPMTAFWCFAADDVRAVVVEVHNTYGGRHAYVVAGADAREGTVIDKAFYVSPFNDVSGRYLMRFDTDAERMAIGIRLVRGGDTVMTASLTGRRLPLTRGTLVRTLLLHPLMPQRVTTQIRLHGVWLWLRRLPLHPRPATRSVIER